QIQGYDVDVLEIRVEPDVELGPVRKRKDADALPLVDATVVQVPKLRALVLRIPLPVAITKGINALLGPAPLFVTPRATECCIESVLAQGLQEPLSLHHVRVDFRAMSDGVDALLHSLLIDVDDEIDAVLF